MPKDTSPALSMPYIMPSQAQKHVTHNEAIRILDILVQATVISHTLSAPPGTSTDGDRHIVGPSATGDWAGHENQIAYYELNYWLFLRPIKGWAVRLAGNLGVLVFDGTEWIADPSAVAGIETLGINTAADAQNRLAVSSPNTLLTHEGAGHQLKINKAAAADSASLLFQTNWSGRAEMGTVGSDDFAIKASADGATFHQALVVRGATGVVEASQGLAVAQGSVAAPSLAFASHPATGLSSDGSGTLALSVGGTAVARLTPAGAEVAGLVTGTAVAQSKTDTTVGRLLTTLPGWQQLDPTLYRQGNIVGTVSQTAGVPTGAIVQRATNANGDYIRWADGTQICTAQVTTSTSAVVTRTWAAAFAAVPQVSVALTSTTAGVATVSAITATSVGVNAFSMASARTASSVGVVAVGRWF